MNFDNKMLIDKTIAVLGLGLIGGSFAKALKHADNRIVISAFDRPEVLDSALNEGIINKKLSSLQESLDSDMIFISLPVRDSITAFESLIPHLRQNQIISDFCSVKKVFADIWDQDGITGIYIGAHPMTGREKGGFGNSDPLLFENSVMIICDNNKELHHSLKEEYQELIKLTGARITFLDADSHDKITASVSHLPQLLAVLLVNQIDSKTGNSAYIDFAGGGFRDMTRIASSDFKIWKPIIKTNKREIIDSLKKYSLKIEELLSFIEQDDYDSIDRLFYRAGIVREEIPFNHKGFIDPLHDITVFVKDQPGMISRMSTVLYNNNINIKDIELLKIREGNGGNFRLFFESADEALLARRLLIKSGFILK